MLLFAVATYLSALSDMRIPPESVLPRVLWSTGLSGCIVVGEAGLPVALALSLDSGRLPLYLSHLVLVITVYQYHRSEEHTSELQSRPHLVCRLLLEKKKKKNE